MYIYMPDNIYIDINRSTYRLFTWITMTSKVILLYRKIILLYRMEYMTIRCIVLEKQCLLHQCSLLSTNVTQFASCPSLCLWQAASPFALPILHTLIHCPRGLLFNLFPTTSIHWQASYWWHILFSSIASGNLIFPYEVSLCTIFEKKLFQAHVLDINSSIHLYPPIIVGTS